MNKVSIVYATKTRHSKKIAEAIGKALNIKAENVSTRPVLEDMDLLFIVGGIYGGESLPLLLDFVKALDRGKVKKAALVTSCASKKHRQDSVRKLLQQKGIEVLDEIICPGSFLFLRFGHPNKRDIEEAVNFAVRLSEKERGRVE
jgi:flavodoxin